MKESFGSLRAFFIAIGILGIISLQVHSIIIGLIWIYLGVKLHNFIPQKKDLVIKAIITLFCVNALLSIIVSVFSGYSLQIALMGTGFYLIIGGLITWYLVSSINKLSS